MMAGPSQTHKKRRVLMELFPFGGVAPRAPPSHPNPMPSSSSHGLNDATSAVARQAAVAGGPIAAMREEPPEPAAEEPAAADSPSPAHGGTVPRMRRGRGKNTLIFSFTLPQYHSLVVRAQEFTFSVQRWPPLVRDDTHNSDS